MTVTTTVVNILVIVVLSNNRRLRNSQTTFKISLAAADLLVGVFVLPTCIYTLSVVVGAPLTTDIKQSVSGYQLINESYVEVESLVSDTIHENRRKDSLSSAYVDSVGFITTISIFVSIYTLAGAGFDRFRAVYKPLSYDKARANKLAKISIIFLWIVAVIIAALPIITPDAVLHYGITFELISVTLDFKGVILYIVLFFIPLVIVWVVNISVYLVIRTHNKLHRKVSRNCKPKAQEVEKKLAATLRLMVGIFTLNILPLWITLLSSLSIPKLKFDIPELLDLEALFIFITVQSLAVLLLLGNSFCNFFIYNSRSDEFRKTLKEVLLKVGLPTCWSKIYLNLRNATGQGRRRLSSVSLNILNIHFKKSSVTEETALPSQSRKSDSGSAKSDQEGHSSSGVATTRCRASSEKDDSVFLVQPYSEYDNVPVLSQTSFIKKLNDTLVQESANKPKIIYK